jgi:hypothetical protein
MGKIKVKGMKGLQKKSLVVSLVTSLGKRKDIVVAEVEKLKFDKRKRGNKKYVTLCRIGNMPYISLTKNIQTGGYSVVFQGGGHYYWLPLDDYDRLRLIDAILYIIYHDIMISRTLNFTPETESRLLKLKRKVAAAKAAYKKHLAKVRQHGFKV